MHLNSENNTVTVSVQVLKKNYILKALLLLLLFSRASRIKYS